MKQIIEWLIDIEKKAYTLYTQSVALFADPEIKTFLEHIAQDEAFHYRAMTRALETVGKHPDLLSEISLDQDLKNSIENRFSRYQRKFDEQSLTIESLIDCIVDIELSEWNAVFTYVVNSLKQHSPEFKDAAARIQQHLAQLEHFLASQPYGKKKIAAVKKLKPVWKESILVVDDNPEILTLLSTVLQEEGRVETAENGQIALEKARKTYFRLIISDVDMPIMDGFEFYRQASAEFPGIQQRFAFLTGDPSSEKLDFFKKYNLNHLTKPVSIKQIKALVSESMHKISIAS